MDSIALALYLTHVLPWAATPGARPSSAGLRRYWLASLCRFDAWMGAIADARRRRAMLSWSEKASDFKRVRPALEDVLLAEPATRLFAAAMSAYRDGVDDEHGDAVYLATSALERQVEARRRALQFMVYGQGFDLAEAVELNRLRRRMERLTDTLLSLASPWCRADRFAHDPRAVRRFGGEVSSLLPRRRLWIASGPWQEERASLARFVGEPFRPELTNSALRAAVETLGSGAFDDAGSLKVFATSFSLSHEGKPPAPRPRPVVEPRPVLGPFDRHRPRRG